jgi:drug/metabolite transporter (DMT)-like permease
MPDAPDAPPASGTLLALLTLYLVWGSTYLGNAVALETLNPLPMTALRFAAAGALLYALARLRGAPTPPVREWLGGGLIGALLLVGGLGAVVFAQQWISSSLAAVIVATMPLWLALFGSALGTRSALSDWLGMGLGLLGVLLLNAEASLRGNPLAAVLAFGGPVLWAFGSALSPRVPQPQGMMASAVQMLAASVGFLALTLLRGDPLGAFSWRSGLALAYLTVFGSVIAYSAYIYLLQARVRPALLASYSYVNPLIAVLLGVGLAGERVSASGYLGMGVILAGVVLVVTLRSRRAAR